MCFGKKLTLGKPFTDILYIGEFPPPYGGISTKNLFIKDCLLSDAAVEWVDMYDFKKNPFKLLLLFRSIFKHRNKAICIGCASKRLYGLLQAIKMFGNKKTLKNTSIFVMGSALKDFCGKSPKLARSLKRVKVLYVELQGIIDGLHELGLTNTYELPNCRDGSKACKPHQLEPAAPIRLVFFSTVNREKGVPVIFEMAQFLQEEKIPFTIDIFGEIAEDFKTEFQERLLTQKHCTYKGVFDVTKSNLYSKLNEYDALLLPTKWKGESCIGVLVESKMSGIPAIVSDHKYNKEIVVDGVEGIVVNGNLEKGFAEAVKRLYSDSELYDRLAQGAYISRTRYDFSTYIAPIREQILSYKQD